MKNLFLIAAFALSFVACSKDDDGLSSSDLVGKWSIYEFEENGEVEPVDLDTELSYWEFKTGGSCEEYNYFANITGKGTYSLKGDVITFTYDGNSSEVTVLEIHKDRAVVEMEEDGEKYIARLKRTDNVPMLYLEPVLDFGASISQIKAKERRKFDSEDANAVAYKHSNSVEKNLVYTFKNGKMQGAVVMLSISTPVKDIESFLSGKYEKLGESDGIFYWIKDKLIVGLSVRTAGYAIVYMQND